jgi:hypothetical protein
MFYKAFVCREVYETESPFWTGATCSMFRMVPCTCRIFPKIKYYN